MELTPTRFEVVYNSFLSKITDDMYLQLTEEETKKLLLEILLSAIPQFEFPRKTLDYEYRVVYTEGGEDKYYTIWTSFDGIKNYDITKDSRFYTKDVIFNGWTFVDVLSRQEINILATYMMVEWFSQQLASIDNVRMKYGGPDFKFTSQANHLAKVLHLKKDYERKGFHLQRLYKRRKKDSNGVYKSTFEEIMSGTESISDLEGYTIKEKEVL